MKRLHRWPRAVLWCVYLALLGVLLPHTAWAFGQFEPQSWRWLGWVAAIAFEGAIFAFTWRLAERIEATPRYRTGNVAWRKFTYRYLNIYSLGLLVAIAVSALANWAHAVQFAQGFAVFAQYSVPPLVYALAFGGILPLCSLLFARILADVQDGEVEPKATESPTESPPILQFANKAAHIRHIMETEPRLTQAEVAAKVGASPSYVSEVVRSNHREKVTA